MLTNPFSMPLPGALRVRSLYPLINGDGSCSLIYDLERAAVLDVPEDLQFYLAPALETGDLDEALVDWMVQEDLLTGDGWSAPGEDWDGTATIHTPAASAWNLCSVSRRDGDVHARIDNATGAALGAAMELVFKQSLGAPRVTFHLGWAGRLPDARMLTGLVVEATRLAAAQSQKVRFELSLDAAAIDAEAAAVLADLLFDVRLHCGSFPGLDEEARVLESRAWAAADNAVRLLRPMGERVTVQCILAGGARLLDLWSWAKEAGVRHLDALRLEGPVGLAGSGQARIYRRDLHAVFEEILGDLEAGRRPIDFQPLTRVVRRLMRRGSASQLSRLTGGARALPSLGDVYLAGPQTVDPALLGEVHGDDPEERAGAACHACWARHACTRSTLAAPPIDAWDRREPSEERCALWRTEAEVALRFYHRLSQIDPLQVMTLFEEAARVPADPFDRPVQVWYQKSAF